MKSTPTSASSRANDNNIPLCVDMDGTLIRTDVLWESMALLIKRNPLYLLALPLWLSRGRAFLKQQIASRTNLNAASLPYRAEFVEYLRAEKRKGRSIILATAADAAQAQRVAAHVGLFTEVFASNGKTNMRGSNKGKALAERFGTRGFDYAGDSSVDIPVWKESRQAIVVNGSPGLERRAGQVAEVGRVFPRTGSWVRAFIEMLRPHQWIKNIIIFVPVITDHKLGESAVLFDAVLAFTAFSLCASACYILNDLLDLDADREHDSKKLRPLALGELPLSWGFTLVPVLLVLSALVAWGLPPGFWIVLVVYFFLTTGYTWKLKQIVLLDVFVLAALYTIRLIGGHEATAIEYSSWLLAFSMFIFLSLALVKRFTELSALRHQNKHAPRGRGYSPGDVEVVAMLGVAGGLLSVLVMALYVNSREVSALYQRPIWLLLICPLLLFWISRVWLIAHRGRMHDDPIVFALKDGVSYLIGALVICVIWLATGPGFFSG